MIDDAFNSHVYPVRTKMNALSLHVCSTDKDKSKRIILRKTFIAELLYRRGLIKTQHCQQNFIAELFCGRRQIMSYGVRQIIMHYYETKKT